MKQPKTKLRSLLLIALCTTLICICSWISVPFSIPFTLQTFAVYFTLCMLGGARGILSILLYVALGVVGLPVFSGFSGGIGAFMQPSGGFIIGFIALALLYLALTSLFGERKGVKIIALALGTLLCYTVGVIFFVILHTDGGVLQSIISAVTVCVLPFVVPDGVKIALAIMLSDRINRIQNCKD